MSGAFVHEFRTPIGLIRSASSDQSLGLIMLPGASRIQFEQRISQLYPDQPLDTGGPINEALERQITEYFNRRRLAFELPLDLRGTPFRQAVLKAVAAIPFGETRTYGEVARTAGFPTAFRAVGTVNARNDLPLVIPCHRVLAANGLGGYGGGLELKTRLLRLEGALPEQLAFS